MRSLWGRIGCRLWDHPTDKLQQRRFRDGRLELFCRQCCRVVASYQSPSASTSPPQPGGTSRS